MDFFFMNRLSDLLRDSYEKIENEQKKREADDLYLNVRVWYFINKHYSVKNTALQIVYRLYYSPIQMSKLVMYIHYTNLQYTRVTYGNFFHGNVFFDSCSLNLTRITFATQFHLTEVYCSIL